MYLLYSKPRYDSCDWILLHSFNNVIDVYNSIFSTLKQDIDLCYNSIKDYNEALKEYTTIFNEIFNLVNRNCRKKALALYNTSHLHKSWCCFKIEEVDHIEYVEDLGKIPLDYILKREIFK